MDSLFSSTSLFFGRSSSFHEAPTPVTETPIMPPAIEPVSGPSQVAASQVPGPSQVSGPAQTGIATPTIVRLSPDNDDQIDEDAAAEASLVVSDILNDFTKSRSGSAKKVNGKTPTPIPGDKDDKEEHEDKDEGEETTATVRSARKRTTRAPATTSAAATPKTSGRTPRATTATKRGAAATKAAATPRAATKRKAADDAETPASKRGRSAKPASADDDNKEDEEEDKEDAATDATPAKLGRKPRASTGAATPAKKVGRTPIAKAPPKPASTLPLGARRGRPPGSKNAASAALTRPLTGRQAALKAHKIATAPPPPKRAATAAAKEATATPQKRGRKPGTKVAKTAAAATTTGAKRGRKPLSTNKTKTTKATKATTAASGKKRGRKPKAEASEYVVESIADERVNPVTSVVEYNVKWEGYPSSENTWEPRDNLAGCKALLKAYEKEKK